MLHDKQKISKLPVLIVLCLVAAVVGIAIMGVHLSREFIILDAGRNIIRETNRFDDEGSYYVASQYVDISNGSTQNVTISNYGFGKVFNILKMKDGTCFCTVLSSDKYSILKIDTNGIPVDKFDIEFYPYSLISWKDGVALLTCASEKSDTLSLYEVNISAKVLTPVADGISCISEVAHLTTQNIYSNGNKIVFPRRSDSKTEWYCYENSREYLFHITDNNTFICGFVNDTDVLFLQLIKKYTDKNNCCFYKLKIDSGFEYAKIIASIDANFFTVLSAINKSKSHMLLLVTNSKGPWFLAENVLFSQFE